MIPWLPRNAPTVFPDVETAQVHPDGLLAAGGDLEPERLQAAYQRGIFPWYSDGQPVLWWSPNPRTVFRPDAIHVSRRLARRIRRDDPILEIDRDFRAVIEACAKPRGDDEGTWITGDMKQAYIRLATLGAAHCAEARLDGRTLGGIYGVAIGRVFFGESMFSAESDGSKLALAGLGRWLHASGYRLVDAQVFSPHLATLGAEQWPRVRFTEALATLTREAPERPLRPSVCRLAELIS